jgi:hypothetical protein
MRTQRERETLTQGDREEGTEKDAHGEGDRDSAIQTGRELGTHKEGETHVGMSTER